MHSKEIQIRCKRAIFEKQAMIDWIWGLELKNSFVIKIKIVKINNINIEMNSVAKNY